MITGWLSHGDIRLEPHLLGRLLMRERAADLAGRGQRGRVGTPEAPSVTTGQSTVLACGGRRRARLPPPPRPAPQDARAGGRARALR